MLTRQFRYLTLLLAVALLFTACIKQQPHPADSDPPQIQLLKADQVFADSLNLVANATAALWNAKKIDAATAESVKAWTAAGVQLSIAIAEEAKSKDPWPTMRAKVLGLVTAAALDRYGAVADPSLQDAIRAAQSVLQLILSRVK